MYRLIYNDLLEWKKKSNRKPLLMQGARQVGKTYVLKEFGKKEYSDLAYFNFEEDKELSQLFKQSLKPTVLIDSLSLYRGKKIEKNSCLIFFDEIQIEPAVLTSLKYFCEEAKDYHVVSAGSLLGVSIGKTSSFPVGKVNFIDLFPMNFHEFLIASDNEMLAEHLQNKNDYLQLAEPVHEKLLSLYKMFLYLGGMPEVIHSYLNAKDPVQVEEIKNEILLSYERDFSKYTTPADSIKISNLWDSIPVQLTKENKKFRYKEVSKNGRASTYILSIEWLKKAGLINISYNIKVPRLPLAGYQDRSKFKLFLLDTGILCVKLNISSKIIVTGDNLFSEYNGAFIENYVASELTSLFKPPLHYWTSKSDAEVDFIINSDNHIIPLEVKSGYGKGIKSLRSYAEKYSPKKMYRTSPRNFMQDGDFCNIPLYAIGFIKNIIQQR